MFATTRRGRALTGSGEAPVRVAGWRLSLFLDPAMPRAGRPNASDVSVLTSARLLREPVAGGGTSSGPVDRVRRYDPLTMADPTIPLSEYASRRAAVLRSLGSAVGVVFAGDADASLEAPYKPHPHFAYLAGIVDEPGAILLLDQSNPVPERRVMLFLKPLNPEVERWDGLREPIGAALREACGIETIFRTAAFPRFLLEAVKRAKRMACLHPLATHVSPVSPDLEVFQKLAQRVPGAGIDDRSELLSQMRAVKSAAEVDVIRRAIEITAVGFEAAMRGLRAGMNEFDLQEVVEHAYRTNGARGTAFRTIAGGGINSTVLHYHDNDQELRDGELVCLDSGARFGMYGADITRTLPVSGRFTPRQREVYEVVLKALKAAVAATREGARISDIDKVARDVIRRAGYGDAFVHGIGHHLGLETHDTSPDAPLKAGAVITIEPGIYLPEERIGIRIEDDVLVGRKGATVLSEAIPREAEDIERVMAGEGPRTVRRPAATSSRRGRTVRAARS